MNSLVKANQPQQPTGGDPFKTDQIGSSNARLAEMQRALAGGRKRKSTKGGAAPGALPNGGTGAVVGQYPGNNSANPLLVKMAVVNQQAEANRGLDGNIPSLPKSGGGIKERKKERKTRKTRRKSHKKRRQYKKKTLRRYKY